MKFLNKIWNYGFFWQVSKMVENNRVFSYDLAGYIFLNPNPSISDFDSKAFNLIKPMIKEQLHKEQDGLCVYCERKLGKDEGQIEHIKPKNGKHAYPHLCFQYSNYAHSCINPKTCGQKKRDLLLPIEPKIGCNNKFSLSTDGFIIPRENLSKKEKNILDNTFLKRLGLNSPSLVKDRKKLIGHYIFLLKHNPIRAKDFMKSQPFFYIFKRL